MFFKIFQNKIIKYLHIFLILLSKSKRKYINMTNCILLIVELII